MKVGDVVSVQYLSGMGLAVEAAATVTGLHAHNLIRVELSTGENLLVVSRQVQSIHKRKARKENFELLKAIHEYVRHHELIPDPLYRRLTAAISKGDE
jgi:hypothetical protein